MNIRQKEDLGSYPAERLRFSSPLEERDNGLGLHMHRYSTCLLVPRRWFGLTYYTFRRLLICMYSRIE